MEKNNKNKCCRGYWIGIILIIILIGGCTFLVYYKMPKRYCHDEINVEKYIVDKWALFRDYPYSSEIMCEEGVEVGYYKNLNEKTIYNYPSSDGKICLIKSINKICVVK